MLNVGKLFSIAVVPNNIALQTWGHNLLMSGAGKTDLTK